MKNKPGIFTALILSLIVAGSALAAPKTNYVRKTAAVAVKKGTTAKKKAKKHHARKAAKKQMSAPTKK
ncbi:MAG TPA: hypothetical protein VIL74_12775 [Pyrinomonadaceae bacterium]|jgi:hypothetical protein